MDDVCPLCEAERAPVVYETLAQMYWVVADPSLTDRFAPVMLRQRAEQCDQLVALLWAQAAIEHADVMVKFHPGDLVAWADCGAGLPKKEPRGKSRAVPVSIRPIRSGRCTASRRSDPRRRRCACPWCR